MHIIPALKEQQRWKDYCEFEDNLGYRGNNKTATAKVNK